MGLTEQGYVRRTYDDILNDKIARAKELFGQDIDTSDLTPLGKFIRINAYDQAIAEEEIEAVYYARFPNTARGTSLDRLLVFAGIKRNPAESACYTVKVTGEPGTTVPADFLVGTETELTYYVVSEAVIGDDGTCEVGVCCTQSGDIGNVNASAINTITNPEANITAVVGVKQVTVGKDVESDAAARERFHSTIQGSGSCNEDAIRAALLRIPTVQFAAVIANATSAEDSEGRPPHSFECYVLGGSGYEQQIAETIFSKKPIGIKTTGDKSVNITDASGNTQTIYFSNTQNISVTVGISFRADNTFPSDGVEQIREKVSEYINNLGIGKAVVRSTLYGYIYAVQGVTEVTALTLKANGGSDTEKISVPAYGIAVCNEVSLERVVNG